MNPVYCQLLLFSANPSQRATSQKKAPAPEQKDRCPFQYCCRLFRRRSLSRFLRRNSYGSRRRQVKGYGGLRRNHDVLISSKRRSGSTRARANQPPDQGAFAAPGQAPDQGSTTSATANHARRPFTLTLLFLLVSTHTHWPSRDGSHLNPQRTGPLEPPLSFGGNHSPDHMCPAREDHLSIRGLDRLCEDARECVSNVVLAGAQLFRHRHHHGSARRRSQLHRLRRSSSNRSRGWRGRCDGGCCTRSRSRTRRASRRRCRGSRTTIWIRTLCGRTSRSRSRR